MLCNDVREAASYAVATCRSDLYVPVLTMSLSGCKVNKHNHYVTRARAQAVVLSKCCMTQLNDRCHTKLVVIAMARTKLTRASVFYQNLIVIMLTVSVRWTMLLCGGLQQRS